MCPRGAQPARRWPTSTIAVRCPSAGCVLFLERARYLLELVTHPPQFTELAFRQKPFPLPPPLFVNGGGDLRQRLLGMAAGLAKLIEHAGQNVQLTDRAQPAGNLTQAPAELAENVRVQLQNRE